MNPLAELRDIHAPPFPGLWPPAPGWWVVGLLVLLVLLALAHQFLRFYRRQRRRRAAFAALSLAQQRLDGDDVPGLAAELSVLLRRVALTRFPRHQVAALSGDPWLRFLDQTGGDGRFSDGPGRALTSAPYQPAAQLNARELYALVRDWVHKNA